MPIQAKKVVTRGKPQEGLGRDAYEQIRDLIVALKLSPGAPLSESDLTLRLGVSRTPIRQALHRLEQEGFVVAHRHGSISRLCVAPLTIEDMKELHAIFSALEGLAARSVAQLPEAPRLAVAAAMRRLNQDLRAAWQARPGRMRDAQDLHVRFHRTLDEAVTGRRLSGELRALQPQVERYERVYTAALVVEFAEALQEHDEMIEAIAKGDADGAERATIGNWRRGSERYARIVQDLGERGTW
ncbi:MAG TPA: GntR family transcriptional regulator [Vicinamibacteria bacterium]|nr:GntR family transcriptional regulator [Vicinamibacteria bacterium]